MESKPNLKPRLPYLISGLLLITAAQIINRYIALPDFVMGSLMGMGIGLELAALIKMKQIDKQANW